MPEPHPEPPRDLASWRLPFVTRRNEWWRLHRCAYGAIHFGKSGNNRFDAPGGAQGAYGVLYAAADPHGAFIETLGRATGSNRVDMQTLAAICLSRLLIARPLHLVDLTGAGLPQIGADERLCSGDDYDLCARWALALYQHPRRPDGLLFRARHDPSRYSLALFDRPAIVRAIRTEAGGALAEAHNAPLVGDILDTYQFQLLP